MTKVDTLVCGAVYYVTGETGRSFCITASVDKEKVLFAHRLYLPKSTFPDLEEGDSFYVELRIKKGVQ